MTKKCIISVLLVVAWALFASLFYKTIMLMLLFQVWKKHIFEMLPAWTQKWGMKPYWMLFFVCLWMAMPRYRIDSNDRVRLVYLDKNGDTEYPPLTQYLINTLIPEEEIVNFGIKNLMIARPVISMMALAAKAFGAQGYFFETHPDPDHALSDGPNMLYLKDLEGVVKSLLD